MISRGYVRFLIPLGMLLFAVQGCQSPSRDDGFAFLSRYRDEWQRPVPGHVKSSPLSARGASSDPVNPSKATPTNRQLPAVTPAASAPLVFIDPGHGGVDTGTIGTTVDGTQVEEKNVALAISLLAADDLRRDGIRVLLSRSDDSLPGSTPADYTADSTMLTPDGVLADLQRRIDRANASGARLLLSIHMNGFADPSISGTQTFYDSSRPFAAQSQRFATLIQTQTIATLRANGYQTPDRGVTDDEDLQIETLGTVTANYNHLVLLGPAIPGHLRPSAMPGALVECFFLTNPPEATAVVQSDVQELFAAAFTRAVEEYLKENPSPAS